MTGDSLGQVASQTLHNLVAVEAARMPVFCPLVGADKQKILAVAREIGTFDIPPSCSTTAARSFYRGRRYCTPRRRSSTAPSRWNRSAP